jgi:4-amino-4-deoxy-L-arabinose transferase-like glycosyltransferase
MVIFFYLLLTGRWFLLRRLNIPLGTVVYFVVVAPWYLSVELRNPGYLRYFLWEENFVRYLTPQFSKTKSWYYFFIVLGVGFLPWSLLFPLTVKNLWKWNFNDAHLFLVLWAVLPFLFFSASNSKLAHYILPIYPAVAILTGQALAARMRQSAVGRFWVLYIPGISKPR